MLTKGIGLKNKEIYWNYTPAVQLLTGVSSSSRTSASCLSEDREVDYKLSKTSCFFVYLQRRYAV
jgi:hypothetical protein